ncbi:MAG TPA: tRNA (adenosine(37)-N6)-threonylcarbamoyltransferase complex transferase subunit TsaD [Candidatus Saccharimonadales bacterium]
MKILGIESSCDETAASVVEDGRILHSNVIQSQIDIHKEYGGVVPEIAARSHLEAINPVIKQALSEADCTWDDIDAIAVTYAPGLFGSLLVGTLTARTLALLHDKPLYPIHHVEAHVYANFITEQKSDDLVLPSTQPIFPMLALIVSGGHSQLVLFRNHGDYELLGQTQDDAVGEAFDKVAKILGLPYPGGPSIAEAAKHGDPKKYQLPKAKLGSPFNFSFSGLKTAVLRAVQHEVGKDFKFPSHELSGLLTASQCNDFAASFQYTAVKTLVDAAEAAFHVNNPASVVIAGGVAANQELRRQLSERLPLEINYAPISLCTDNAAMIATLAYYQSQVVEPTDPHTLHAVPSLSMKHTAWASSVSSKS